MRRGFYLVLMLVMVLRGLTGTAMAAGVLQPMQPANAPHVPEHSHCQAAAQALGVQAADGDHTLVHHDDHHDRAAHAAAASSHHDSSAACAAHDHHAAACSACEICHSAMLDAPSAPAPALRPLGTLLPTVAVQFDSAPAALAIKPPIA